MGTNIYDPPFYKPPKVATAYPRQLKLGVIELYEHGDWNSQKYTIDTSDTQRFPEGEPFSFAGNPINDKASWIAFCLPEGTVCTLVEHVIKVPPPDPDNPSKPYNFAGAGICVDLIGNGKVQTVDLIAYGANDMLSGGIWRRPDYAQGWFQLFEDNNCNGRFDTIFFAEWTAAIWHPLTNWTLNGTGASANYPCLTPPQMLTLARGSDGSGQQVALGATNTPDTLAPATVNFDTSSMSKAIQAFRYDVLTPVKAEIESVTQKYEMTPVRRIGAKYKDENRSDGTRTYKTRIAEADTYTVESTATLQYGMSLGVSQTTSVSQGIKGIVEVSASITTSFEAKVSNTTKESHRHTETFSVGQTLLFHVPPWTEYYGEATVAIGNIEERETTTNGKFYYLQKLPGAKKVLPTEPGKPTLWYLEGPVTVRLKGNVASQVDVQVQAKPIPH